MYLLKVTNLNLVLWYLLSKSQHHGHHATQRDLVYLVVYKDALAACSPTPSRTPTAGPSKAVQLATSSIHHLSIPNLPQSHALTCICIELRISKSPTTLQSPQPLLEKLAGTMPSFEVPIFILSFADLKIFEYSGVFFVE